MELYIMRHGLAEANNPGGDAERRLTEVGRAYLKRAGSALHKSNIGFDRIVVSPYVRATETAGIIAEETAFTGETFTDSRLIPSGRFESVSNLVFEHNDARSLLLISHQPLIGETISQIVGQNRLMIRITPGMITAIDVAGHRPHVNGTLVWSLPAEMLADTVS